MWLLLACAPAKPPPTLVATSVSAAPAAVVLARLDGERIVGEGSILSDQWVDIDAGDDLRHGFRYELRGADGAALYARSTQGPVIVRDFLDYYSELTGLDVLGMLPGLGEFPVTVPLLPGAASVAFQFRTEDGYVDVGSYDLDQLDGDDVGLSEGVVGTEALHTGGPSENRLDLVLVGDGYTKDQLDTWRADAAALAADLLDTEPYRSHTEWLNVWRVDAVSAESGVSYDCDPECTLRDTAFGTVFAMEVVNRFTGSHYRTEPVFQLEQWEVARAVSHVPWDAVVVVANTPHEGGMAVHYATVPTGNSHWTATGVHELGHAFGLLGDEYTGDFCIRSVALGLPENITDRGEAPPWPQWIEDGTPLPTQAGDVPLDTVGAFAPAYNCDELYRPRQACRMEDSSGGPFCPVCAEVLVRRLFRFGDPADEVTAAWSDGRVHASAWVPDPAASLRWTVDGAEVGTGTELDAALEEGQELRLDATWSTEQVRDDQGDLTERWSWALGDAG